MNQWFRFVGPEHALEVLGIRLVGFNATNGKKLLFSLVFVLAMVLINAGLRGLARLVLAGRRNERVKFWIRQAIRLGNAVVLVIGLLSIWFDDPTRLATALAWSAPGLPSRCNES